MITIKPWLLLSPGACNRRTLRNYLNLESQLSEIASMCPAGPSARTITELNIAYYRNLLKNEADASKREIIAKLLAEEKAKLAKILEQKNKGE